MQILRKIVEHKEKKRRWKSMVSNTVTTEDANDALSEKVIDKIDSNIESLYVQLKSKTKTKYTKLYKKCEDFISFYNELDWKNIMNIDHEKFKTITIKSISKNDIKRLFDAGIHCINIYDYISKILEEPVDTTITNVPDFKRLFDEVLPFGVVYNKDNFNDAKDIGFMFVRDKLAHIAYRGTVEPLEEKSCKELNITREYVISSNKLVAKILTTIEKNDNEKIYEYLSYSKEEDSEFSTREKRLYMLWSFLVLGCSFLEFIIIDFKNTLLKLKDFTEQNTTTTKTDEEDLDD